MKRLLAILLVVPLIHSCSLFEPQAAPVEEAPAPGISEELRQRIIRNELPIGSDLVWDESMSVQGGLVYTYYKNGDYDEFIYHERSEGPGG